MRRAPAVSVRGSGGPVWRAAPVLLAGLVAATLLAWMLAATPYAPLLPWLVAAVTAAALAAAVARARRRAGREPALAWDGQAWTLDGRPVDLAVALDFPRWMLLRCRAGLWSRWLALDAAEVGAGWHALRVAVHGPRPLPQGPAP